MQAKQNRISRALLIVMLLMTAADSWAITIRHDRSDLQYTGLANTDHPYGGIIQGSGWYGSGTLISPNWVLTAGHCLSGTITFQTSAGTFGIDQQIPHSSYDIGLAHLTSPVTTIEPVKLYDLAYGVEDGQECIIMGAGNTGTGLTGQLSGSGGARRAAETYVYANGDAWGWGSHGLLTWFRSPGSGAANLEGGSAQGDSGGGVLLNVAGEYAIAGVMSQAWWGGGGGDTIGKYDTGGFYIRSAPLNSWITQYATDAVIITESVPPTAHYTFRETAPGRWEVLIEVTGDTAGLSAYELWVDNVDPALVSYEENTLYTVVGENYTPVGFFPGTMLQGQVAGSFNAGNFQSSGEAAIPGVGMVPIDEPGWLPGITPHVELDVPALLGVLSTPTGLGENDIRAISVGLLDETGDGYYGELLIPTYEVIPLQWLEGDANGDGVVSAGDYSTVQANFGSTGDPGIPGDANGDGVVSAGDYASVQANFGNIASANTVPEPTTILLLGVGLIVAGHKKNRR